MSEHLTSDISACVQPPTAQQQPCHEQSPILTYQGFGSEENNLAQPAEAMEQRPFTRLHKVSAAVVAAASFIALAKAPAFNEQPAFASSSEQASVKMPFGGRWAYNILSAAACGPGSGQTSHPSCHEINSGDWSTDLYAAAGTDVKLDIGDATGDLGIEWEAATGSCGETRRVKISVDNTYIGRVSFTHLKEAASTEITPTNGMVIGKIANLSCNPGGTLKHVHMEVDNSSTTHACYTNHSTTAHTAGHELAEGTKLGVIGSSNDGTKQSCSSPSASASATATPVVDKSVTALSSEQIGDTQHVYWATADGKLRESWFRPGEGAFTNTIDTLGRKITAMASEYVPADMSQRIYVGDEHGTLHEYSFSPTSGGYHGRIIDDTDAAITSLSDRYDSSGTTHLFWGTANGRVRETWFNPAQGDNTWEIFRSNSAVYGITNQYTPNTGLQHVYWGNNEGRLHESAFRPGFLFTNLMADFPEPISSLSSQTLPDGSQHIYSGSNDGKVRETWFNPNNPGSGYNTWEVATHSTPVHAVSSQYTADGIQHVYSGTDNQIAESWFRPGLVNHWTPASNTAYVTALSSQRDAQGTTHLFSGRPDGSVWETWFNASGTNSWPLPTSS